MAQSILFENKTYSDDDVKDIALCRKIWQVLDKHYQGHPWMVGADHRAGTVTIQLAYNDKVDWRFSRMGWILHINKLETPEELKKVMRAGGDMLERFNLKRDAATENSRQYAKSNGLIKDGVMM